MLKRLFDLQAHHTDVRMEVIGGSTTFVPLSYIIFVQPAVLATTGVDAGAVMTVGKVLDSSGSGRGPTRTTPPPGRCLHL